MLKHFYSAYGYVGYGYAYGAYGFRKNSNQTVIYRGFISPS